MAAHLPRRDGPPDEGTSTSSPIGARFHDLRLPSGAWPIVRLDGCRFPSLAERHFDRPFDSRFAAIVRDAATAGLDGLDGVFAYAEVDTISILLPDRSVWFDRPVEQLVSEAAGIASAAFTLSAGLAAHFDSRVWVGTDVDDVIAYFSWRQAEVARRALDGWCEWTLRTNGNTPAQAAHRLHGASVAQKRELLEGHGVRFNEVPAWQRRGVILRWLRPDAGPARPPLGVGGSEPAPGVDPGRRRVIVDVDLPMGEPFQDRVAELLVWDDHHEEGGHQGGAVRP